MTKNRINRLIASAFSLMLMASIALLNVGCDDTDEFNEWDATYVSLTGGHLGTSAYTLIQHTPAGILPDSYTVNLKVRVNKAQKQDIEFFLKNDKIPTDQIEFPESIVIPAGETETVVPMLIKSFDWIADTQDKKTVTTTVSIDRIATTASGVNISSKVNSYPIIVEKKAYAILSAEKPAGSVILDRSGWKLTINGEVNSGSSKLIDDNTRTYLYMENDYWVPIKYSVEVDLGEVRKVEGLYITFRGTFYSVKSAEIFISDDGANWKSIGDLAQDKNIQQYYSILGGKTTRYVKFFPKTYDQYYAIAEFNIFAD